jgi:hypothetical protein
MKSNEEIAQIAGTLARADNPWSWEVRMRFVEEEQLDLRVHLIASVPDRH